jgi:hypothetical protein
MTRQELEQALQLAYAQHQDTLQALDTTLNYLSKNIEAGLKLATTLHDMNESLQSLLLLHLQNKPVQVYELLSTLAARYARNSNLQNLAALSQAAGQVH